MRLRPVTLLFLSSFLPSTGLAAAPQASADPSDGGLHQSFAADALRGLRVESAGGDVRLQAMRGGKVRLEASRRLGGEQCAITTNREGNTLVVISKDPSGRPCVIDLQVKLPPALAVHLTAGVGNVFVSGMRNALELELAEGNAVLGGIFPKLHAQLDQGSLSVQGLAGPGELNVVRGNVQVFLAPLAQRDGRKVALQLQVGSGNVAIVAAEAAAVINVATPAGNSQSSLDAPAGNVTLQVDGEVTHGNFVLRQGH